MGVSGTFICKACANRFPSSSGGTMMSTEIRCEDCDSIDYIDNPPDAPSAHAYFEEGTQEECGIISEGTPEEYKIKLKEYKTAKGAFGAALASRKCATCGGHMFLDLMPKCPACGSREVELDGTASRMRFN